MNLHCMRHSDYEGHGAPDLACKVCCKIYVDRIRMDQTTLIHSQKSKDIKKELGREESGKR